MEYFKKMTEHGCTPDGITYCALISGLCKESRMDDARGLYEAMTDKGISPCEVARLTLAYEYCIIDDSSTAMIILDKLDKKLWIRTVNTLIRKLCNDQKVDIASVFFHKLIDRVSLAAFMTACYESDKYELVADVSERILKRTKVSASNALSRYLIGIIEYQFLLCD